MKALQGFSLIEQLIACSLSICVLGFLSYLFIQLSANAKIWQEKQQSLNNAHTVTLLFLPLLQQAGIHGCRHLEPENMLNFVIDNDYDLNKPIQVFHSPLKQDSLGVLSLGLGEGGSNILGNTLLISGDSHLKPKDIILISDCLKAEVHRVEEVRGENGNNKLILQHEVIQAFSNNTQIYPVFYDLFYLYKHSLFRERKSKPAQELLSNVYTMQIKDANKPYLQINWTFSKKFDWSLIIKNPYG